MQRLFVAFLLCALAQPAFAVDTDGDGLLDLIDVPGFDPGATGDVGFCDCGIEDLDGASLLTGATSLGLPTNRIGSIEKGDFQGLANLQGLSFWDNRITSLENQAFDGLGNLQFLELDVNQITSIETGTFQGLANLN